MATVGWGMGRKATLTIPNGGTNTDTLDLSINPNTKKDAYGNYVGSRALRILDLLIEAPAALTGTVKPAVSNVVGGPFVTLQTGGVDISLGAGKATAITPFTGRFLQLQSSGAEGAARAFVVTGMARNIER